MLTKKKLNYFSEDFLFGTIVDADHTQLEGCCAVTVLYDFADDSTLKDRALEVANEMQFYNPDPPPCLPTLKDAQAFIRTLAGTLLLATTHEKDQTLAGRALAQLGFRSTHHFRGKTGAPLILWVYEKPRRRK